MEELKMIVKELIIESLELEDTTIEDIQDDVPLFSAYDENGVGLGLDSVDSLELIVAIKKKFNIKITDENLAALQSVNSLVKFIEDTQAIGEN